MSLMSDKQKQHEYFKIPLLNHLPPMNDEQKQVLCESITLYAEKYLSENRLPNRLKDSIQLDKYLDLEYNLNNSPELYAKVIADTELVNDKKKSCSNINSDTDKYVFTKSLPWLEAHELNNHLWKPHIDKRRRNEETRQKMATVDNFKCRKCHETKCRSYQLQTASIDEPMTTYIECTVCGHRWKF